MAQNTKFLKRMRTHSLIIFSVLFPLLSDNTTEIDVPS